MDGRLKHRTLILREEPSMRCRETGAPFFSLSYGGSNEAGQNAPLSYTILSRLKKDSAVVLAIDSSLFVLPLARRETQALCHQRELKACGLDGRFRKYPAERPAFSLDRLFGLGKRQTDAYEMLFYIPDAVWHSEGFHRLLPVHGARYYVCKDRQDEGILDELFSGRVSGDEKRELFALNIFDCAVLGQMGMISYSYSRDELLRLIETATG